MSTTDDETGPEATTAPKPRRPPRPRAKPAEASSEAVAAPPTEPAPKPRTAKPVARRAPSRAANRRTTAAPRREERSGWPAYGALAGAAGVGLALGLLGVLGRKAAVQAPTALAEDWASALAAEHKAAGALFDRLESTAPGAGARRINLLAQLKHLLARHALQEENIVYPALRRHGWPGETDDLQRRSAQTKDYLYTLANSPAEAPSWLATLRSFRTDFEQQARLEDDRLFPALRGELTEAENAALATAMNREGFKLA